MYRLGRNIYQTSAELFTSLIDAGIWVKISGLDMMYYLCPCTFPAAPEMKAYYIVPADLVDSYNVLAFRNYYFDYRAYGNDTCLDVVNDIFEHRCVTGYDWRNSPFNPVTPLEIRTTEEIRAALEPYTQLSFTQEDANTYFNGEDADLYE